MIGASVLAKDAVVFRDKTCQTKERDVFCLEFKSAVCAKLTKSLEESTPFHAPDLGLLSLIDY